MVFIQYLDSRTTGTYAMDTLIKNVHCPARLLNKILLHTNDTINSLSNSHRQTTDGITPYFGSVWQKHKAYNSASDRVPARYCKKCVSITMSPGRKTYAVYDAIAMKANKKQLNTALSQNSSMYNAVTRIYW